MLLIHLAGAVIMFLNILLSVFAIWKNNKNLINFEKYFLAVNFFVQVTSGLVLANLHHSNFINTCAKLGIYLGVFVVTEALIFNHQKSGEKLPTAS